jgi:hypothetical protein
MKGRGRGCPLRIQEGTKERQDEGMTCRESTDKIKNYKKEGYRGRKEGRKKERKQRENGEMVEWKGGSGERGRK